RSDWASNHTICSRTGAARIPKMPAAVWRSSAEMTASTRSRVPIARAATTSPRQGTDLDSALPRRSPVLSSLRNCANVVVRRRHGSKRTTHGRKIPGERGVARALASAVTMRSPLPRIGRRGKVAIAVIGVTLILLIFAGQIVDLWTDYLWFGEVQYTAVF